jgi:hypothetical protein
VLFEGVEEVARRCRVRYALLNADAVRAWAGGHQGPVRAPAPCTLGIDGCIMTVEDAAVAQLARASACHAEGRGFEPLQPLRESPATAGVFCTPCR